jgi:hypothetical protein
LGRRGYNISHGVSLHSPLDPEQGYKENIYGAKRDEVVGEWRSYTVRSFIFCTHPKISLGTSSHGG